MPSNSSLNWLCSLWQSDFTRITLLSLPRSYTSTDYASFCTIFTITQFVINRVRPQASAELVHMKAADQFKPKPNSICNAQIRLLIKARALILYPHMCSSHKHIEHFLILNSRNWKIFHGFCFTGYLSSLKTEKTRQHEKCASIIEFELTSISLLSTRTVDGNGFFPFDGISCRCVIDGELEVIKWWTFKFLIKNQFQR